MAIETAEPAEPGENSVNETTAVEKKSRKKSKSSQYDCEITCLDNSKVNASVDKSAKGEVLFHQIVTELSITAKEYVGLLFHNEKNLPMWLDIHKDMKHQLSDLKPIFEFRVKFYEPEPARLQDEYMRYLLYLQLREDLVKGKLVCNFNTYALLGSYTAQAELGDFNLSEHDHDYLNGYEFAPSQTVVLIKKINELHRELRGQTPAQAELSFLEVAKKIRLYGVDIHNAQDVEGPVQIGVSALGVNIYRNEQRIYIFRWQHVDALLYNRRKFTVKLKQPVEEGDGGEKDKRVTYVYYFDSAKGCKQCYKSCVEYHTFFRLTRPDAPRKKADNLRLGSSFRYSDRTLYQLRHPPSLNESDVSDTSFKRSPSKRKISPAHVVTESPIKEDPEENKKPDDSKIPSKKGKKSKEKGKKGKKKKKGVDEPNIQYEEIEIDEANPDDDKFDPKEWEVIEKTLPDGSKKRYRRRIILTRVIVKKKPHQTPIDGSEEDTLLESKPIIPVPVAVHEEPMQYEEIELDEANPEDEKYDPKEWEVVEKTSPDGAKKRYRRRIIVTVVKRFVVKPDGTEEEVPLEHYEEIELDEANPDDEKYDPKEYEVVEKTSPDGAKKRYRRRIIVTVVKRFVVKPDGTEEEVPLEQCEEIELDEANLDDEKYDPKEWEIVEKTSPDGAKKRYLRRVIVTTVKKFIVKPDGTEEEIPLEHCEEIELDSANPDDENYDPKEWEVVEKTSPDGEKKRYRRRIIVTKRFIVKPDGTEEEVTPEHYEEIELDEANPDDEKYDPKEWEVVEKTLPDGSKKRYRRRILVTTVKKFIVKPDGTEEEVPLEHCEEIELDEANPDDEKYDPKEWEVVEKTSPDGAKKRYLRRVIVTTIKKFIVKPDGTEEEVSLQHCEEIELDEANPDDENYDPKEWEIIEKTLPDGEKKRYRRRIVVTKKFIVKPDGTEGEVPIEHCEEIELDEANPDDVKYDPKEWEIIEKTLPDGPKKRYRRRIIGTVVKRFKVKPDGTEEEVTPAHYEEIELNEANPDDEKYDPKEWEVVEKALPDGSKKRYRRRILVTTVKKFIVRPDGIEEEVPLEPCEEIELDEANPEDEKYDPKEWEVVEKTSPDGAKKRYLRRVIVTTVKKLIVKPDGTEVEVPIEHCEEIELDEANPDDVKYDPKEWEVVEKTSLDGAKKKYLRRIIVTTVKKFIVKPDGTEEEVPIEHCEEIELDEANPDDENYDPKEWEVVEKTSPDGEKKRYRRRIIVTTVKKFIVKPNGAEEEVPLEHCEEIELDEANPDDEKYDPKEWEIIGKTLPNGTKMRFRRRFIITSVKPTVVNPDDKKEELVEEEPEEYEEIEIDEANPEDDKYDPEEWEIVEKTLPDGSKKRYRRRVITITIVKRIIVHPDGTEEEVSADEFQSGVDDQESQYEEIEVDEANPEDNKYDPEEWEIIEKTLPDGSKKKYRRRIITTTTTTVTTTRYIVHPDGTEEEVSTEPPVTTITIDDEHDGPQSSKTKDAICEDMIVANEANVAEQGVPLDDSEVQVPSMDFDMDDILSEINDISKSLAYQESNLTEEEKRKRAEAKRLNEEKKKRDDEEKKKREEELESRVTPDHSSDEEESEEEKAKRKEEQARRAALEKKQGDDLNATISSIFSIDEAEYEQPKRHSYHGQNFDDINFDLAPSATVPKDDEEGDGEFEYVNVFDVEYAGLDDHEQDKIRTASLQQQKKDEARKTRNDPAEVKSLDRKYIKRGVTLPHNRNSYSGPAHEGEKKYRKASADNARPSGANQNRPNSEIVYTLTDVSNVEQGRSGFVQGLRAKHEGIANDEQKAVRLSRVLPDDHDHQHHVPKGHVPTRNVSFKQNDEPDVRTTSPPAIKAKATVIVPASSELPDEEVLFEVNQSVEESNPDIEFDTIESTNVPEVETHVVMFKEIPADEDINIAPVNSEPGLVETQVVKIVPQTQQDSTCIENIQVVPAETTTHETDTRCIVTTHTLPTEVITRTITIEGDSSSLTPEELQKLIEQAGGDPNDDDGEGNYTTTQVISTTTVQKVITGHTITVTGDADGEEMQKALAQNGETINVMIQDAVANATQNNDDGTTIVVTAVQNVIEEDENGDTEI